MPLTCLSPCPPGICTRDLGRNASGSRGGRRGSRGGGSSGWRSREARGGREGKRDLSHAEHVEQVKGEELEGRVGVGEWRLDNHVEQVEHVEFLCGLLDLIRQLYTVSLLQNKLTLFFLKNFYYKNNIKLETNSPDMFRYYHEVTNIC